MPKRSRKSRDLNALAASIVEEATGDSPETTAEPPKNPAAVELGRLGGLKGGQARASKLSPQERSEAAKRAAEARWKRK